MSPPGWQPDNFENNVEAGVKPGDVAVRGTSTAPAFCSMRSALRAPGIGGTDLATTDETLPHDGFGARYSEDHAPVSI
ncbi:hypothetical protein [Streptomyces sp. NPDC006335]|uniref:hypothetical protein n=1 Tax=Streptomyces sp. NPDC006335 TaxID=3156895 RepID=UPI0033A69FA6